MSLQFISQSEINKNDISNKLTYTHILETIPSTKTSIRNLELLKQGKTEWRWRFLKFENRFVTEISYIKPNMDKRMYFKSSIRVVI